MGLEPLLSMRLGAGKEKGSPTPSPRGSHEKRRRGRCAPTARQTRPALDNPAPNSASTHPHRHAAPSRACRHQEHGCEGAAALLSSRALKPRSSYVARWLSDSPRIGRCPANISANHCKSADHGPKSIDCGQNATEMRPSVGEILAEAGTITWGYCWSGAGRTNANRSPSWPEVNQAALTSMASANDFYVQPDFGVEVWATSGQHRPNSFQIA